MIRSARSDRPLVRKVKHKISRKETNVHCSFTHKRCRKSPACANHKEAQNPAKDGRLRLVGDGRVGVHDAAANSIRESLQWRPITNDTNSAIVDAIVIRYVELLTWDESNELVLGWRANLGRAQVHTSHYHPFAIISSRQQLTVITRHSSTNNGRPIINYLSL